MFIDLKKEYENIDTNKTKKKVEEWFNKLSELMNNNNNYDSSLEETNNHFSKLCGISYKPVAYHDIDFQVGHSILIQTSSNFNSYRIYYQQDEFIKYLLCTHPHTHTNYDIFVTKVWDVLKMHDVEDVYEKILKRQLIENQDIEQIIRNQLDKLADKEQ